MDALAEPNPTGRYRGQIFKPFVALFGSTEDARINLLAITNASARVDQQTNALCPAPNSAGFAWEAAANVCVLAARTFQDTPYKDINNQSYPDMPVPENGSIGDMAFYDNRDALVKGGCSTVILSQGAYKVQDFVTTYHPAGEVPLQYAYVRNLVVDFNVAFGYRMLEQIHVVDRVIVADDQITEARLSIKPAEWRSIFVRIL